MAGAPNVVLTGFMGTGKSVVGRALAATLGRRFVDTDEHIVERYGPIATIFAEHGEDTFRRHEHELATELSTQTDLVIATGGGMLMHDPAREALAATGRVVCLTAEPATIVARVIGDGIDARPLLAGDDPEGRVAALLATRAERYGRFEQVATDDRTVDEIVADIVDRLDAD